MRTAQPWTPSDSLDPHPLGLGLSLRDLRAPLLLHLSQFEPYELTPNLVRMEATRIAEKLALMRENAPSELTAVSPASISETRMDVVDSSLAKTLHDCYHYLGSSRVDGIHLGLWRSTTRSDKPNIVALATFSPFDMSHVADALPVGISQEQVLILSRLYAFDWAPRNAISYMLGRAFEWIRTFRPETKLLLTYLNPNLGFTGASYKATNWTLFGFESKKRYLYLDGTYVTDRRMIQTFGTANIQNLKARLGTRISISRTELKPLQIHAYFLDKTLRGRFSPTVPFRFEPWSL